VVLRVVVPLALLGACSFDPSGVSGRGDDDGRPDPTADGACGCELGCDPEGACRAFDPSNLVDLALVDGVTTELTLTAGTWILDTDVLELRGPDGAAVADLSFTTLDGTPSIAVLAVARLAIEPDALLRGTGHRALLVAAADTITVDGAIDVAAGCPVAPEIPDRDRLWCGGPGGGDGGHPEGGGQTGATGCAPGGNGDAGVFTAENGGGGGGFGSAGGHGGGFDGNGSDSAGGIACGAETLEPLGGGSGGGGAGYRASGSDDNRTAGGGGGGALQLTAGIAITITGTIDAAGEGGAGTAQAGSFTPPGGDGGGGGGGGGGILLEAPALTIAATARLTANGGGGGAGITVDQRGERGRRERTRAAGGLDDAGTGGGAGAIGSGGDEAATDGAAVGDGSSGGGGGAGRIHLHAAATTLDPAAIVSPNPTTAPLAPL